MKKKLCLGILLLMIISATAVYWDDYNYRQRMNDVSIVHYFVGSGSGYSTVYLTAIVSLENYREELTVKTILRYVIHRNKDMPDTLRIILYESMEKLSGGDSYFEVTFHK